MNKIIPCLLLAVGSLLLNEGEAQVRAIYDHGANALSRSLQRLQTTASVLHTGAHPDDEDSALVAYHARREHARTAYLSLTRGSGGQNIIGTEQSHALGVIRTEELLQARRLDGAEQLFTRALDFGFSKHRSEAARQWDEDAVLGDMVRAIRLFRPNVIVSRWNGTPADGHGHHQFAGYLTPLAFAAAADLRRFPEHFSEGLLPWQADKLYIMRRGNPDDSRGPSLLINTGESDPVSGRSYFQIGMQGRSQQKTQQMGSLELHGRQLSALDLSESVVDHAGEEQSVFDGVDTSIRGIANHEPSASQALLDGLDSLQSFASEALSSYRPLTPAALVPVLANGLRTARETRDLARAPDAVRLLDEKVREFQAALVLASGITVDALADAETVVPGSSIGVTVRIYRAGGVDAVTTEVNIEVDEGWTVDAVPAEALAIDVGRGQREHPDAEFAFEVTAPASAEPTQPYWLKSPPDGFNYDWSSAAAAKNRPFGSALVRVYANFFIDGQFVTIERDVEHRVRDLIRGEVRRRLDVVPMISVEAPAALQIVSTRKSERVFEAPLTVRNNAGEPVQGTAGFDMPDGWQIEPATAEFALPASPASTTLRFTVTLPEVVRPGEYKLAGSARVGEQRFAQAMQVVAYPHIHTHRLYEPASMEFEVIDVDVAPVHVGYVMGSGDKVPEALRRLGIEVDLLDDSALTSGDLSRFDVIVIGIRASQTRADFVANNGRLLDYVRGGGTMIVQYQQPDFIEKGLAPFAASMAGNVRVVDETAPITVLAPQHPVFTYPNRIVASDFDGWVQERNNYNFTSFDTDRYVPLTEAHDEGEPPSEGGMLYAKIGDGHYVYTAYSWFRQLPNGVPGAYRIFANMLSLSAAPQ